ncbi:hypothetical protein [Shewanella khirikhana]|jgi:hypothetical protein|uniref:Uncharacterized protein n=1 Tax=Shewanella khirikhana TaxID=1965282 RepID=A0ABM7DT25_9GAMM|nr:hypothetical protein [Shewanella khirikhana]AZQ12864.1 hypothetical protein STH12_03812 [Shewanella khirikhana]
MDAFFDIRDGRAWFRFGQDLIKARQAASACDGFLADDEDEQQDDVLTSCLNCARRRWSVGSFECMKKQQSK